MILDLCGGEAGTVVSAGAEPAWRRQRQPAFRAAVRPWRRRHAAYPGHRHTGAPRVYRARPHGNDAIVVSTCRPGATTWPATLAWTRRPRSTWRAPAMRPRVRRPSSRNATWWRRFYASAAWTRSLPSRCRRCRQSRAPTLSPRQSRTALARRLLAARGLRRMRHLPVSCARAVQAANVRLRAGRSHAAQPDRRRSGSDAPHAPGHPGAGSPRATSGRGGVRSGDVRDRSRLPSEDGQSAIAAALRAGQPARHWPASADPSRCSRRSRRICGR